MQQLARQSGVCLSVSGNRLPPSDRCGAFVINLGSSSTPVALTTPADPALGNFTFFVSRRREDGRERFRLHMGYFETLKEAEALLEIARKEYPGAWAGTGPGRTAPVIAPVIAPVVEPKIEPMPASAPVLTPAETLSLLEDANVAERTATAQPHAASAVAYAVQLRWSAQPISLSELPALAIFDAYTLYRARGSNYGSTWHALRLGFFNDAVSARQVANYVESECHEVTVVPVSSAERDSAVAASAIAGSAKRPAAPAHRQHTASTGLTGQFKLIEDDAPAGAHAESLAMVITTDMAPESHEAPVPPSAASAAGARRPPATREEKLQVLGAGKLKLDGVAEDEPPARPVMRPVRQVNDRAPPARSVLTRLFDRFVSGVDRHR